jgi:hypothetical protein
MRYFRGLSFPRSGHHLLVRLPQAYFPPARLRYVPKFERQGRPAPLPPPTFAERLLMRVGLGRRLTAAAQGGAQTLEPSTVVAEVMLSKNHDFDLKVANDFSIPCLIQYRSPIPATISNYYLHCERLGLPRTRRTWSVYAPRQLRYWRDFVRKWLLENDHPQCCRLPYEQLVGDPPAALGRAISFLYPDEPLAPDEIERICQEENVAPRHRVSTFEFYDREFLAELEASVEVEIERLGLPSFDDAGDSRHGAD